MTDENKIKSLFAEINQIAPTITRDEFFNCVDHISDLNPELNAEQILEKFIDITTKQLKEILESIKTITKFSDEQIQEIINNIQSDQPQASQAEILIDLHSAVIKY